MPLPIGNGEQRLNAMPVVEAGGGFLVADADLTLGWLREHVLPLLTGAVAGDERLRDLGVAAARVGVRDGAARVADIVEEALR